MQKPRWKSYWNTNTVVWLFIGFKESFFKGTLVHTQLLNCVLHACLCLFTFYYHKIVSCWRTLFTVKCCDQGPLGAGNRAVYSKCELLFENETESWHLNWKQQPVSCTCVSYTVLLFGAFTKSICLVILALHSSEMTDHKMYSYADATSRHDR